MGNPHASLKAEWLLTVIDEDHQNLAAIVRIDCSGCIEACHSMPQRKARPRPHLPFKTPWNLDCEAGWHSYALTGQQLHGLVFGNGGTKIQPGGIRTLIGGKGQILAIGQPDDSDLHWCGRGQDR